MIEAATVKRLVRGALLAAAVGAGGCRAGLGGASTPAAVADVAPSGGVVERGEPSAITALAFRAPTLVAGTARGVRLWEGERGNEDEYETLGPDEGLPGNGVTAIGLDGDRNVWVATDAGIGRFSRAAKAEGAASAWRYQAMGGLAGITTLAPTTSGRDVLAWAGGADGLYRGDGTSWTPVDGVRGFIVSSLDLDADGRSAWVGTRARGLFHVDASGAREVPVGEDPAAIEEIVGTALTAVGTRVAAARAPSGSRLIFLEEGDAQSFRAQPDVRIAGIVDTGHGAELVAGPVGAERAYALQLLEAGEPPPPGGLRFVSVKKGTASARLKDRWVAVPLDVAVPPGVSAVAGGAGELFVGTTHVGVARAAKGRPAYLAGASLVGDADRLTVACASPARCFAVTDGPRAWLTDGDIYKEVAVGEADDATVLAVVTDRAGTIYALSSEPKYAGLVITRLARAAAASARASASGDLWKGFQRVPLTLPAPGPGISFAAISPAGVLWVGLRAHSAGGNVDDGGDVSAGALELDLASHHAIHHRALAAGERGTPEMLPLPAALTNIFFEPNATWFSSLSGVTRFSEGELRRWGENEGLRSELVHGVARGAGDTWWAATSEGLARLEGGSWRAYGGGEDAVVATRAIVRGPSGGELWVATAKGLRRLSPADVTAGRDGETVLPGDFRDVTFDRTGRAWALSSSAIALVSSSTPTR
ncbi:MAG TPA: hypothetical protein VHJ20_03645 [Polyangia bacterium]|nr:hypothetical protein [Polyangia bacterium]